MICVVVYADAKDREFFEKLNEILQDAFTPLTIWKGEIISCGERPALLLCDHESLRRNRLIPQIILFGGRERYELSALEPGQTVVIVDSCDQERLRHISSTKLPAITCGRCAKDTITLSSMTDDSAVINLQRSITCFHGDIAEPQEIPVKFSFLKNEYLLMAAASIYILTGNSDRLSTLEV